MNRGRSQNAFLLVGAAPAGDAGDSVLANLTGLFEERDWPVAFVAEPGPQRAGPGRPRPGDLIIQTHSPSLAREPAFMNLYSDFGEPQLIVCGAWERNFLIGTIVDLYLSGFAAGLAHDACSIAANEPLPRELREFLAGFSYAISTAYLREKERTWWF